jgi:hypothetical protein
MFIWRIAFKWLRIASFLLNFVLRVIFEIDALSKLHKLDIVLRPLILRFLFKLLKFDENLFKFFFMFCLALLFCRNIILRVALKTVLADWRIDRQSISTIISPFLCLKKLILVRLLRYTFLILLNLLVTDFLQLYVVHFIDEVCILFFWVKWNSGAILRDFHMYFSQIVSRCFNIGRIDWNC